jgi:hypothetical protein
MSLVLVIFARERDVALDDGTSFHEGRRDQRSRSRSPSRRRFDSQKDLGRKKEKASLLSKRRESIRMMKKKMMVIKLGRR